MICRICPGNLLVVTRRRGGRYEALRSGFGEGGAGRARGDHAQGLASIASTIDPGVQEAHGNDALTLASKGTSGSAGASKYTSSRYAMGSPRIGRTTRRLTLLREYRRGRCRVRCRCRSSQNAVEMLRFGAGNHESMSRRRGGSRGAGSEAQRGRDAARAQSGWGRGWGGWEFRAGRTQRRCAGVIGAAGLARGEMGEDSLDDLGRLDARDDAQCAAAHATVFDVRRLARGSASLCRSRASRPVKPCGLSSLTAKPRPASKGVPWSLIRGPSAPTICSCSCAARHAARTVRSIAIGAWWRMLPSMPGPTRRVSARG